MAFESATAPARQERELLGQTVVLIGGTRGHRAGNGATRPRSRSRRDPHRA